MFDWRVGLVCPATLLRLRACVQSRKKQIDDMKNASDPEYVALRNQAIQEGNLMHEAFEAASRAYKTGDGASAKELSNKGHQHDRNKDELNARAANWIYEANNRGRGPGEIDLHGLYVQEAIEKTEAAVQVRGGIVEEDENIGGFSVTSMN